MPPIIHSRKNELVKNAVRLSSSSSTRREQGLYFLEGARLCEDAARSGVPIRILLCTEEAEEKYAAYLAPVRSAAEESYEVDPQVAELLSGTKTTQGVFCVCRMKNAEAGLSNLVPGGNYLALENMQDPANLGTVLRTAEALGIRGVLLSRDSCDIYSPKVLRASMGAVFRLPLYFADDMIEAAEKLNHAGFLTYAAVPDREAAPVTSLDFQKSSVMFIGNEGNGLREETQNACSFRVTIPMMGRAESLNASASAAILAWEMMRGGALHDDA